MDFRNFSQLVSLAVLYCACLFWGNVAFSAESPKIAEFEIATNGMYVTAKPHNSDDGDCYVEIYYFFTPPSTNIPFINPYNHLIATNEDGKIYALDPEYCAVYFGPSNMFYGPVRLIDTNGCEVSCLRSNDTLSSYYPAQYSLQQAKENLGKGHLKLKSYEWRPVPITGSGRRYGVLSLKRTFLLEKSGDYQLTIWPIIYKRFKPDWDLLHRVDLSPVTIPVHWDGNKTN